MKKKKVIVYRNEDIMQAHMRCRDNPKKKIFAPTISKEQLNKFIAARKFRDSGAVSIIRGPWFNRLKEQAMPEELDDPSPYIRTNDARDLLNGNFILLKIDLTLNKKKVLLPNISKFIDFYKKRITTEFRFKKSTKLDPWEVYQLYHVEGLLKSEIARRLYGIKKGKSSNNYDRQSAGQQVTRALKRAEEVIKHVKNRK